MQARCLPARWSDKLELWVEIPVPTTPHATPTAPGLTGWTPAALNDPAGEAAQAGELAQHLISYQRQLAEAGLTLGRDSAAGCDVANVEQLLLEHLGALLQVQALFVDRGGACRRVALSCATDEDSSHAPASALREEVGVHIEAVRQGASSVCLPSVAAFGGTSALLLNLPAPGDDAGVVIAIASGRRGAYTLQDAAAAESLLTLGSQALVNVTAQRHLQQTVLETVCALVNAIDAKDNYTSDHSERVGILARQTGIALGLPKADLQVLEWSGLLHDIGKIGISEDVLRKPGKLTPAELQEIRRHPQIGHEVLRPLGRLGAVLDAVRYHHENHDGTGYPDGLNGSEIPLVARIIHIVDMFDAMTTNRPYRGARTMDEALAILRQSAGTMTDPHITAVFEARLRWFLAHGPETELARFTHLLETTERPLVHA